MSDSDSEPVTIVFGDGDFSAHTSGQPGGWYPQNDWFPSLFNDSMYVPDPAALGNSAGWVFNLDGVSISLFGVTPPALPTFNQTIAISNPLDPKANSSDVTSYTPYTYPSPALGGQFLTTGRLPAAAPLKLGIVGYRGLALNYALVEVGEFTSLTGTTILVDDSSTEIAWSGGWTVKNDYGTTLQVQCQLPALPYNATDNTMTKYTATMVPHGNSTHVSSAKGDSFTFPFAGTTLSLYGIPPGPVNDENWQLKMQFSIDGTNNNTATFTASQFSVVAPHFLYYTIAALSAGNHTLTATVLDAAGSANPAAQIDYLVYNPTFDTVHDKPVFPVATPTPTTGSSSSPGPTGGGGGGGQSKKHSKAGPIAGGVIGGLIFLAAVALLAFWLLRRRKRQQDVVVPAVDLTQEPFLGMPSIHHDEPRPSASNAYRPSSASYISSGALSPPSQSTQSSPPPSGSSSLPIIIPSQKSQHSRTLTQQRDDLAEEIRRLGSGPPTMNPSASANANAQHTQELESRVRELQNQMEVLTREMRYQQMVPPEYEEGGR
ncbi:hypothetical protein C8F01DRAFT_46741 [Mycena amicta]|nr:hypothetical protein C8F01DRAFT_46741 [Mycena amicta]